MQTPELNTILKSKNKVSASFFYIFMIFEIVTEIDLGSELLKGLASTFLPLPQFHDLLLVTSEILT